MYKKQKFTTGNKEVGMEVENIFFVWEAAVKDDGLNGEHPGMKMRTFSHSPIKMKDGLLATFSSGPQHGLRTKHLRTWQR